MQAAHILHFDIIRPGGRSSATCDAARVAGIIAAKNAQTASDDAATPKASGSQNGTP